jgi:hypothetical protein
MGLVTPEMTVLEVIFRHRETEKVFRNYDSAAGVCLCCQALFESLEDLARKYSLDLDQLMADLEVAAVKGET